MAQSPVKWERGFASNEGISAPTHPGSLLGMARRKTRVRAYDTPIHRRTDYRALTGSSKCDYVQSLARLPRQPGFRVARLGMKPPVNPGGFALFQGSL